MNEAVQEKQNLLEEIPIAHWLMLALLFAGLYIFVLMRIDASRARSLDFRQTSETNMLDLASHSSKFAKPSPFGKPAGALQASRQLPKRMAFRTLGQVALRQSD